MGYRKKKADMRANALIRKEIKFLNSISKEVGYNTDLTLHKLNQMDRDLGLVMDKQCAISAALEGVISRQDRLMVRVKKLESTFFKAACLILVELMFLLAIAVVISF